ncbi:filamentation induced by cAMP protein Fic [Granulicella tundricola MP5ACTX9]|uniref:protein adenylyltransferase n=2 Tax=Granulicella TaxID=940557 RepID=E8WZS6_GRATM|nr:filamentation induced by cAMP protein Fic [Granulicella tundricola MP5ACTX9]
MSSGFENDPHSERGHACPRNKFGITNYAELSRFEAPLSAKRLGELEDRPMKGSFDSQHLRAIHRYLFRDVFPWAGEFRVVNISKGGPMFGPVMFIGQALDDAFGKLAREKLLSGLTVDAFADRAAFYLGEINAIHPFREGNGRTQREFIRQLAVRAGHTISWAGFTQQEMIDASIKSHVGGENEALAEILRRALMERGNA